MTEGERSQSSQDKYSIVLLQNMAYNEGGGQRVTGSFA